MPKQTKVCAACGSDEVFLDAWAVWNISKQEWVLDETFPNAFCRECDGGCKIKTVEVEHPCTWCIHMRPCPEKGMKCAGEYNSDEAEEANHCEGFTD